MSFFVVLIISLLNTIVIVNNVMSKEKKIVCLVIMDIHFILYRLVLVKNAKMDKYLTKSLNVLVAMRTAKLANWKI